MSANWVYLLILFGDLYLKSRRSSPLKEVEVECRSWYYDLIQTEQNRCGGSQSIRSNAKRREEKRMGGGEGGRVKSSRHGSEKLRAPVSQMRGGSWTSNSA
jgi:hypothetical protein